MIRLGLTGGIGSGKSAVLREFLALGAECVDADQLAREVVSPMSPALAEIAQAFGRTLIEPEGTLDRAALSRIVFENPQAKARLEAITHPRIEEAAELRARQAQARGKQLFVYEAALIVQTGITDRFDALLVVDAPVELRIQRVMARDALSAQDAQRRIDAQGPIAALLEKADFVLTNDGRPSKLANQVRDVYETLISTYA